MSDAPAGPEQKVQIFEEKSGVLEIPEYPEIEKTPDGRQALFSLLSPDFLDPYADRVVDQNGDDQKWEVRELEVAVEVERGQDQPEFALPYPAELEQQPVAKENDRQKTEENVRIEEHTELFPLLSGKNYRV